MLDQLDKSLEALLRDKLNLGKQQLDIAFEAPDKEWSGKLPKKATLNLFLWDIRRSVDEAEAGRERFPNGGVQHWRLKPPRIAFSYLLTAWTTQTPNEHRLLGEALRVLLASPVLEEEYLSGDLGDVLPRPTLRVARPEARDFAEFWSAIDGELKPGLDVTVTATVDPGISEEAGRAVEQVLMKGADPEATIAQGAQVIDPGETPRARRRNRKTERLRYAGHVSAESAVGAKVTSPRGATVVDGAGNFLVAAEEGDVITIHADEPVTLVAGEAQGPPDDG